MILPLPEGSDKRPVTVVRGPSNNKKHCSCDPKSFLQEAKVTDDCIAVLQKRFDRFCVKQDAVGGKGRLALCGFRKMNSMYKVCKAEEESIFFSAMCQGETSMCFEDFLFGCAAASPMTPHILNSHTGMMRARYIFRFYNSSGSGDLDFEELARLVADASKLSTASEDSAKLKQSVVQVAQELGEVSVITLRVSGSSGPLCEFRASKKWSVRRISREIARELQVPEQGLKMQIGGKLLDEHEQLESFVSAAAQAADVKLVHISWELWSSTSVPDVILSDSIPGLERLVHVSFDKFRDAFAGEKLRGTSRLFRFVRSVLHTRSGSQAGSQASSAVPTPTGMAAGVMSRAALGGA
eukprot:TRINITY_DN47116_c0_g1_i1.p1 TRINITY_DN47116_c0_g1~~TRINITY_DN47116_c0_g1_i1.p1  ORF type:complete len:353 (-),score=77.46 TRINITY_DN47116_c0_g1_i1:46-1104(-)